ncbi:MAG: T9SS type A sorting domain-containing protein, partial [Lewinella sp.]
AYETQMEIGKEILVSVVFDGTQERAKDRTKMYLDGVEQRLTGGNSAPATTANLPASIPIYIGREVNPYDSDLLASYTLNMDYNENNPDTLRILKEASGKPYDGRLKNFSFSGNTMKGRNELDWTVIGEENVHHYTVERSSDGGRNWMPVSTILARANGAFGAYAYQYGDAAPPTRTLYRICIVDFDGTITISEVIHLHRSGQEDFDVYPNPTSDHFTVALPMRKEVTLELSDIAGRPVWTKAYPAQEASARLSTDAPPGVYLLTAHAAGIQWSKRVVRQ